MSYPPLNNVTTGDRYDAARTLECPGAARVNIDVSNAAIFYQLGTGIGAVRWGDETFMTPAFRSLDRRTDAVRVRSAVAGAPAQVTVDAIPREAISA